MTHPITLRIDYKNGLARWINCALVIDGERHPLDASVAFPPFQSLLRFIKAVAGQRLPARYSWDEEGVEARFEATAIAGDNALMRLKITHDEADEPWFDRVIERDAFVQAFLPPILDFSQNYLLSETEWYLPRTLVNRFHQEIVSGIPLRSDTHSPQVVQPSVTGDYDHGYLYGCVFFKINFEEQHLVSIVMFDTDPFWKQVVDFMKNIASGDLPTSCEYIQSIKLNDASRQELPEFRMKTRLVAEPVDVPDNFRLKIITAWQDEPDFLLLEEVVDRRQCAQGFADSFRNFLDTDYRIMPDKDGMTFDLRTLPLEKFFQA